MQSDQTKLRQNLFNLLSNAAKFTKEGLITVAVRRVPQEHGGDWVEFHVTDTGIGMTAEQKARCSRPSPRPTPRPPAPMAAPASASPSPGTSARCSAARSRSRASSARARPSACCCRSICPTPAPRDGAEAGTAGELANGTVLVVDDERSTRDVLGTRPHQGGLPRRHCHRRPGRPPPRQGDAARRDHSRRHHAGRRRLDGAAGAQDRSRAAARSRSSWSPCSATARWASRSAPPST